MFVFGSNENFKMCFRDLLTFSIYIFVNLQFFILSNSDDLQYLAHRIQQPIPKLRKFVFFWSKSFTSFCLNICYCFLICLKNRENYNTTSEKC